MSSIDTDAAASDPTFSSIQRQMQRVMDQMQKSFFNFCPSETWTPNVNLYENDTAYLVCVDLAGVDKEKIEVVVADQRLTLKGTRLVPAPEEVVAQAAAAAAAAAATNHGAPGGADAAHQPPRLKVHVMEIDHGPFCREVELPENVDKERISASHRNGLLWIELPKA